MDVKCKPIGFKGKAGFELGRHHIEIDIQEKDTDALRECLDKQCAGLTSNHKIGGLTTEESLGLSLLQHYSSCYWLKSLDYASLIVMKGFEWLDESTWNKFRATIDCHQQSKSITIQEVVQVLKKFQRFWAQQHPDSYESEIICYGFYESSLNLSRQTFYVPENPATSSSPHPTHYLWYDKNEKCFDAITCLSNFYQETASYWDFLMLRAEICLDHFFERQFDDLSDDELKSRSLQLNDEVKSIRNKFHIFQQQFNEWKIGNEFDHLVLDMDHCIRSPDENSKDSASAWCEQLWQLTTRCFARQFEQACIDRKRKMEMNRRETNSKTNKIQENIEGLQTEIAKVRQRTNENGRGAADEARLLEKLAWSHLLHDLANPGFVPNYNLACQRQDHEIYKEKDASQLAVKIFDLIHRPSPANKDKRAALEKYVKNQSNEKQVLEELHSALDNFIGQEISNRISSNQVLTIEGKASVVLNKIASAVKLDNCREIVITAERVIYVDCDWKVPGISVTLSAPLICVVSAPDVEKRTITTSGRDGKEHESPKAADGNGVGASGSHGLAGEDGEDAGNVEIDCESFTGHLKIVAHGGKGTNGQAGGNGQPGHKGSDGADGTFPSDQAEGSTWYYFDPRYLHNDKGWPGSQGGNGGSGGNGGTGGRGGLGGLVKLTVSQSDVTNLIERDCGDGKKGKNGNPGRGAEGGSGGKHGQDAILYFEPDEWLPSIVNTGQWRRHKGSRTNLEKVCLQNRIIGYKIRGGISSNIQHAAKGKRGTDGKKATHHLQQRHRSSNATADVAASQFHSRHKTGKQDDGDLEWENQLEANRSGERRRANEAESIDRMSRDIVGEQNAISHLEKQLVIDRQRHENITEIHQHVRSKIQETLEQRIAQQSVVGQRITRQQKLNFKDDDLVLSAASNSVSSITDSGRDVRSGRPVSHQPAAAIPCLAKVDDSIKSLMMSKDDNNKNVLPVLQTVQCLVLNLSLDDHENEWNSIEKIVCKMSSDSLKLADSLEFISSNLPLILSPVDQSPESCYLMDMLRTFLMETGHDQGTASVICVLYEFHQQRPITVQQVLALLDGISDWTQQTHILLGLFFDEWMLSSITKTIFEVYDDEELGTSRASLFTDVWLRCSPLSKWTRSAPSSAAVNKWLTQVNFFLAKFQICRGKENNILLQFAREQIGITQDSLKICDKLKRWQLVFVVDHFQPKVDELDEI